MSDKHAIRELAAEITNSLLSLLPGTAVVMKVLPKTSQSLVRTMFGADRADTLEDNIAQILEGLTQELLTDKQRGSLEYGAIYSGIKDFRASLSQTRLDAKSLLDALVDPTTLTEALRENTPKEHKEWASAERRSAYDEIVDRFSSALLTVAPQFETVRTAIALETYRLLSQRTKHP